MSPTLSTNVKVLSPTLHLYHYVLRSGINERSDTLNDRRKRFSDNLQKLADRLTSSSGKPASDFVKLVPIERDLAPSGILLDLTNIPSECQKPNDDRLYFETGIIRSRLAARRLNDTYLLRFTKYVSSTEGEQSLKFFENLSEHIANLPIELGQTVILAGIIPTSHYSLDEIKTIATSCLSQYYGSAIASDKLIVNKFLGSPFCIYAQPITVQQVSEYSVESIHLACVFLYEDPKTEQNADKVYRILQDLLLSFHKIHFFYSQNVALKKILSKQYEAIERQTEEYAQQKWESQSLKKLPQQSLEYYKKLSFLEDQAKLVEVNLKNYRECLQQIEQQTGGKVPDFFAEFEQEIVFYQDQMQANIGFLTPGIQLFEKLMLSVQTQVSIDDEALQRQQNQRQAKLGQILAGVGAAIGVGQIINPPITASISQYYIDKGKPQQSVSSLWLGAGLTITLSILAGCVISTLVYHWFTQKKS